jgi:hypothetical protein
MCQASGWKTRQTLIQRKGSFLSIFTKACLWGTKGILTPSLLISEKSSALLFQDILAAPEKNI